MSRLTPRQTEVLEYIAAGKTDAEIAVILRRSKRTIEKHHAAIKERLGIYTTAGLARFYACELCG